MSLWKLPLTILALLAASAAHADAPTASYIFPAGGQRGKAVNIHVGGLFLHDRCPFEMLGPGVSASKQLQRTKTAWFEGPLIPLPDSQQAENYPKDLAGRVEIAPDAPLGIRCWRLWNAQGATPAMRFMVGDLPEIVEQEMDGDPVPVQVQLPVTINGRIFPRENVDIWSFQAQKGQTICGEVHAARLGSPLDSRLEVLDPHGQRIAENDDTFGADSFVRFTAPVDGLYQVRIQDVHYHGGQDYIYRLTLTADPYVDRVYPLGGRRGSKVKLELSGQGLPAEPVEVTLSTTEAADFLHRLAYRGKQTNPFLLDLDDLPEYLETEPNDRPADVKPLSLPAMLNGRIDKPGDVDYWAFRARKGEVCDLDLRSRRLGSSLNAVLSVRDAADKELARAESDGPLQDPALRFTAPADGIYLVRVEDRFPSRGGPAFAYRLRMAAPAAPDFRLHLASDVLAIDRGKQGVLKLTAERLGGLQEPIQLSIDGLPNGVTSNGTTLTAQQGAVDIPLKVANTATIRAAHLTIRGTAKIGGRTITRTATLPATRGLPELDSVLLAVTLPTPFKVVGDFDMRWAPRGTILHRHYRLERGGFQGPVEISLSDRQMRHLQGVTGTTITVPAGVREFDYAFYLPPWMETGRTARACVMAVATVKDTDGTEHVVSYCSVEQNEQMVAVVEPGRLGIEAERGSILATPGKTVTLPVRLTRGKGLQGVVKLELIVAEHLRGIAANPLEIAANQDKGSLLIRFGSDLHGPFNVPLVLRATVRDKGEPVVAETKVELQPAP